jgi:hypothetical protein
MNRAAPVLQNSCEAGAAFCCIAEKLLPLFLICSSSQPPSVFADVLFAGEAAGAEYTIVSPDLPNVILGDSGKMRAYQTSKKSAIMKCIKLI